MGANRATRGKFRGVRQERGNKSRSRRPPIVPVSQFPHGSTKTFPSEISYSGALCAQRRDGSSLGKPESGKLSLQWRWPPPLRLRLRF
jgi:hypothetical protein